MATPREHAAPPSKLSNLRGRAVSPPVSLSTRSQRPQLVNSGSQAHISRERIWVSLRAARVSKRYRDRSLGHATLVYTVLIESQATLSLVIRRLPCLLHP